MRRRAAPAALLIALLLAGCVYYPTVPDTPGVRIVPKNGRAVRQSTGLAVYMDLESTARDGDALISATAEVARVALIVAPGVEPARIDVPGISLVRLHAAGPYIALSDLTRAVAPGESILVQVLFEKSGMMGVVTRVE